MLVIVTASHRRDTFRALEKTVDLVKANVPIWKKEIFTDGTSKWIE
jgi:molybdopterin synthase catalytic subunit